MARRVKSVRTHVDTSAKTGMLYAAQWRTQPQQTWCQRGYSMFHGGGTKPPKAHIPPSLLCLTGPHNRERRAGKEKDRVTHHGKGREKVHAREEGEPTESRGKGKERRSHGEKEGEASSRARDARREGGTASTRRAQHRNEAPERGAPEGQAKGNTTHRGAHSTGTTHTAHTHTRAHSTWPAGPGGPPRGQAAGKGGRLNQDAPRRPSGAQPPTGHVSHGASAGPLHPHSCAHSTWVADPNYPPGGRAVRGGGMPDPRRPSQRRKAPPPGTPFRHPHSAQRRPARAHTLGPVLGPHARTDRSRDTWVAEPWLPAPKDGRPGEGQRLTPHAPHNGGRPPPPGTAPHRPRGTQPPQGMQAEGTVLGPDTRTPAPTARGWTPSARPEGGQSGEGERLTSDGPHNAERHPLRGRPSAPPTASNAGPQGRTLWGQCWVPTPAPTAPETYGSRNLGCPPQRTGGRGRDST